MDVREKLTELIKDISYDEKLGRYDLGDMCGSAEYIADLLISHGVTVQECKLGVKKTNADRIRSMTDEELAMCLYEVGYDEGWDKPEYALNWLQQPAQEDDNG